MERELLLLGLLRGREMHGYQINKFIDDSLGVNAQITRPTAYRLLSSLADKGWVTSREEQEGNRPSRRVYAITLQGEEAFQRLLRQSLAGYRPVDLLGDAALLFLDALPTAEALTLLRERRAAVASLLQAACTGEQDADGSAWLLQRRRYHLTTELGWVDEVIHRVGYSHEDAVPTRESAQSALRDARSQTHPSASGQRPSHAAARDRGPHPPTGPRSRPVQRRERPGWSPEVD